MIHRTLACLLLGLLPSLAPSQVISPHPRLILDTTLLTSLRARGSANTPQWTALKTYCDAFIGGKVNYPDEATYPDRPDIGQAYQGEGYWAPLLSEALCYQTLKMSNAAAAAPYGAKAVDILMKISLLYPAPHAEDPCKDSGYVIRFYGVLMGIGYDWLYELLTPAQRQQVYTTANNWVSTWETNICSRFAYEHPQGNYFAGYFHAKAAIALATYGDNPNASAQWIDWQNTQFRTAANNPPHIGVLPYYQQHLTGGGWPEGFGNYGPLATLNMILPIWEAKTAAGIDFVNAASPFTYPVDMGEYAMHFTWPSRDYFDDRDDNHANGDSSQPPAGTANTHLFVHLLGAARFWHAPHANVLQTYANEVDAATGGYGLDLWENFLFHDPNGTTAALSTLPRSYFAAGMNAVAARSDWTTGAAWMSFRAGPYVNNPGAGHELFDQGALALVRGKTPLLVNGTGWIVHEPEGNADETRIMADNFGSFTSNNVYSGNRTLNNVFYVRHMSGASTVEPFGQFAAATEDRVVGTHVSHYEDGGNYVYTVAEKLEDMYRPFSAGPGVAKWARQVVYVRPNRFVVYDRTQEGRADYDQYLAFHFPGSPISATSASGTSRLDVSAGGGFAGSMSVVLPANATTTTIAMYPAKPSSKVWEVQVRPADTALAQRWLTVFDLSSSSTAVAKATAVSVDSGNAVGALLADANMNTVVLSNAGTVGTAVQGPINYRTPAIATHHVLTELNASTGYSISVAVANGEHRLTVAAGGAYMTSANGVLEFNIAANGVVNGSGVNGTCGDDNGKTLVAPPVNLCSAGAPSALMGTGPWTWTCQGSNGGSDAGCAAQKAIGLTSTSTLLSLNPNPVVGGQGVTAVVRVSELAANTPARSVEPAAAGGTVAIYGGGQTCDVALVYGSALCAFRFDAPGTILLTASYLGDDSHAPSSNAQTLQVQAAAAAGSARPAPALGRRPMIALLLSLSLVGVVAYRRSHRR